MMRIQLQISYKQLDPCPALSLNICLVINYSYLFRQDGAILRPPKHSWMSEKAHKQAVSKQPRYECSAPTILELLVNANSYYVTEKICLGIMCTDGVSVKVRFELWTGLCTGLWTGIWTK